MKTIVFGASGYLGSHVAEQLCLAGHEVTCIVRINSNTTFLESLPVAIVRSDFCNTADFAKLIDTDTVVLNCLAETRMHLSDDERRVVECQLTSSLFSVAAKVGAKRFVQLSTVMAYGFERPEYAIDEAYPVKPKYSYSRIACEREQSLIDLHQSGGTELLILRPSNTFGKRDSSALPIFLASHEKGIFSAIGGGNWKFSCMDARDTGRAMVHLVDLAIKLEKPELFLVKGYDTTWLELKSALDEILERRTKLFSFPKPLAKLIGSFMELASPLGGNPPLTRFNVDLLSTHTLFNDEKIRATGFRAKYDLMETLQNALGK